MRQPYVIAVLLALTLVVPTTLADGPNEAPATTDPADAISIPDEPAAADPVPVDPSLEQLFRELDATHGARDKLSTCPDEGCHTDYDCQLALEPPYCQGERKCYIAEPGCPGNCYCTN